MKIKKINSITILNICLLTLNSFLAFPSILYSLYLRKNKEINFLLLSLCFSVLAYFFIPPKSFDLYRHYLRMDYYIKNKPDNFYDNYLYLKILGNFLIYFSLPKEMISFFSCFLIYFYNFKIFDFVMNKGRLSRKNYFLLFCIFLFNLPLISFNGIRFMPALSLSLYGLIGVYYKRKNRYYIYILFSIIIHYSFIIILIVLIFQKIFNRYLSIKVLKIFALISLIVGFIGIDNLVLFLTESFKFFFKTDTSVYILGKWGTSINNYISIYSIILNFIRKNLRVTIFLYYIFILKNKNKFDFYKFNLILISVCFMCLKYHTLFGRYSYFVQSLIFISLLLKLNLKKQNPKINILLFLIIISIFIDGTLSFYDTFNYFFYSYIYIFYKISIFKIVLDIF